MSERLDIIVFGATGFTGKHTLPVISKLAKNSNPALTWGVAGRSEEKLKDVLRTCDITTGESHSEIPIVIANIDDEKSLLEMAGRARIIINCCGPYRFFGEAVIKACVQEGTHHVDVSGEPQYMEKMQLLYHEKAKEKGVYIISACGWDSIPADLGVIFMQNNFKGVLNSIVTYVRWYQKGDNSESMGSAVNYGTWESAVYGLAHANELGPLRRQLFKKKLPQYQPKLKIKSNPHKEELVSGWVIPFLGADKSVIKRSQYYFHENDKKRPIQVETYMTFPTIWNVVQLFLLGSIFKFLVRYEFGRKLLLKHPKFFSGGIFSHDPPSESVYKNSRFSLTLYGKGWKEELADCDDQYNTPPDSSICATVQGDDPAYGTTCVCLTLAAITILKENEKMPSTGGVYPPGYAFAKTSLIEKLQENDVEFDVVFNRDLIPSKL